MFDLELERWNDEEHRCRQLMQELDGAEMTSEEDSLHRAAVLETGRRVLRESKERLAALLAVVEGGRDDG